MRRRYYSERHGRTAGRAPIDFSDLKRMFLGIFEDLEREGYFQEQFGYECVDAGRVPGLLGGDLKVELQLALGKPGLWPFHDSVHDWSEEDVFDLVEFLYDHVSEPTERYFHQFSNCGWHCSEFDREPGQVKFREKLERLLRAYDSGFELSTTGEVLALADPGLGPLLESPVSHPDEPNVVARVESAKHRFRRHRSSVDDKRAAVRELADVLEFLRPSVKQVLPSQDERDLFNIVNNFGIRHHRSDQKTEYHPEIWLAWLFYYYLAAIHGSLRLIESEG